ncbi:capsular polysaccharide biosynthesis protein [Achromobacter kerstersii]|uniref:capsular polysaccharide biosynthesis protein n=1 Tax=Achromobacter kerstersii TaxID=1353890 RepID=UPI0006C57048|nr:capsular polysaccharide biosynthesis protein [Achromobacter kerstersii]CUI66571.1 Capsule polysaccharide biosynthesis protein [Achromobacter kerstersii]
MPIGTFSHPISKLPGLAALIGETVVPIRSIDQVAKQSLRALTGWGFRPSTNRPRALAAKHGIPFIGLEDGFLRSYGTGRNHPTLSLVVDPEGIYYAAGQPSALETLLTSGQDLLSGAGACYAQARDRIVQQGLSKYNLAPDADPVLFTHPGPRVLIVDQTVGDGSVEYGLASAASFSAMLAAARRENPDAIIYIKTHPEVSRGTKRGFLSSVDGDSRTVMLREPTSPASVLRHMDRVYVVTSHMGFEALLHGVPVTCFGVPWYAGWGCTDDRIACPRRKRTRTVNELFAGAYLHYTRYLNPETYERGTIFDVMDWLVLQRQTHQRITGRTISIGYRRWKAENVKVFLGHPHRSVHFVPHAEAAEKLAPKQEDRLVIWGASPSHAITALAARSGATLLRMEDGFVRSIGLGSDFVPPHSLVIDARGLYFDARQPSDLEQLLNTHTFTDEDRRRARIVRDLIVSNGLTKYNIESTEEPTWHKASQRIVLVPGQVEDDASIKFGCTLTRDNLTLLEATRRACPDAFIVYKPHPDVMVRNRAGRVHREDALRYADAIETKVSIVGCIEAADELHTMTSLSGFDALLRGKRVVVHGKPFYAGWGLTEDREMLPRRDRTLTLDELVAGAVLHYPLYWDWTLNGFTTGEAAIRQLASKRNRLVSENRLASVQKTHLQRQLHKLRLWAKAGFLVTR